MYAELDIYSFIVFHYGIVLYPEYKYNTIDSIYLYPEYKYNTIDSIYVSKYNNNFV